MIFDIMYQYPGSKGLSNLKLEYFFTNSKSSCSTYDCKYTFKDSSGNLMQGTYQGTSIF